MEEGRRKRKLPTPDHHSSQINPGAQWNNRCPSLRSFIIEHFSILIVTDFSVYILKARTSNNSVAGYHFSVLLQKLMLRAPLLLLKTFPPSFPCH